MEIPLPTEKKLSVIRKYPLEIMIFGLAALVSLLLAWQIKTARQVSDLQAQMIIYLNGDHQRSIQATISSTEATMENTRATQQMTQTMSILINKK